MFSIIKQIKHWENVWGFICLPQSFHQQYLSVRRHLIDLCLHILLRNLNKYVKINISSRLWSLSLKCKLAFKKSYLPFLQIILCIPLRKCCVLSPFRLLKKNAWSFPARYEHWYGRNPQVPTEILVDVEGGNIPRSDA